MRGLARRAGWPLIAIMTVAGALRLAIAARTIVYHADEVWQYLEPAYGLVTGRWVRAWEFHDGIRGWFVPLLLSGPIALGHALAPSTPLHLWLTRGMLALLSLGVPLAWYDLARSQGRPAALVVAWVGATWVELIYFASRTSAEGLALTILFPAMALARRVRENPADRRLSLALGFLLALGIIVRFQYLPAIGLIALWAFAGDWRRVLPLLVAGGLFGLALGALADGLTGHPPLSWIWNSFRTNLVEGRSEMFGTQPPAWLASEQARIWSLATIAIAPLALIGGRRRPMLLLAALAVIAAHSAIAHKEYRFILLGGTTLVLLAAIASTELVLRLAARRGWDARRALVGLALGWTAISAGVSATAFWRDQWTQGDTVFGSEILAGEMPGLCGFATYQAHAHPQFAASFINRDVPLLLFDGDEAPAEVAAMQRRFNAVLAGRIAGRTLPPAYRFAGCHGEETLAPEDQDSCLYVRPGPCGGPIGDFAYQPAMERRGK